MFIGHYAVGFASKKFAPKASLGLLVLAPLWADIVWPIFLLTGHEHAKIVPGITKVMPVDLEHMPYSHSLVALTLWGALFAATYFLFRKDKVASLVLWFGVISHWILDYATHRPDMPLSFHSTEKLGLGLWNYPVPAFIIETILFAASIWIYVKNTKPVNRVGTMGLWLYVAILYSLFIVQYAVEVIPPDMHTVAVSAFLLFPLIPLLHWVDRSRTGTTAGL